MDVVIKRLLSTSKDSAYKARIFKGKQQEGFAEYTRGYTDLKNTIRDVLGKTVRNPSNVIPLQYIVNLYAMYNIKVADSYTPLISLDDLYKVREYDRDVVSGYTGKLSESEFNELREDIRKNGIKDFGIVEIERKPSGNVSVLLVEGNHRLVIGRSLGIKYMPIMFYYS